MRGQRAKLTPEKVAAIQASTEKQSYIARQHGIDPSMVSKIRTGTNWKSKEGQERILLANAIAEVNKLSVFYDSYKDPKRYKANTAIRALWELRDKK